MATMELHAAAEVHTALEEQTKIGVSCGQSACEESRREGGWEVTGWDKWGGTSGVGWRGDQIHKIP